MKVSLSLNANYFKAHGEYDQVVALLQSWILENQRPAAEQIAELTERLTAANDAQAAAVAANTPTP